MKFKKETIISIQLTNSNDADDSFITDKKQIDSNETCIRLHLTNSNEYYASFITNKRQLNLN